MRDELWIDGKKADMDDDSGVWLHYRSNVFGKMTDIIGSWSNTIRLPMTAVNMALMECAYMPGSDGAWAKRMHRAELKRDGIEIVRGQVRLVSVGADALEVVLTWGVSDAWQDLIGGDRMLSELDWSSVQPMQYGGSGAIDVPLADYGIRTGDENLGMQPVVSVADVLDIIEETYGVQIGWDSRPWASSTGYDDWVLPLMQRKAVKWSNDVSYRVCPHLRGWIAPGVYGLSFEVDERETGTLNSEYAVAGLIHREDSPGYEMYLDYWLPVRKGVTLGMTGHVSMTVYASSQAAAEACTLVLVSWAYAKDDGEVLLEVQQAGRAVKIGDGWRIAFVLDGEMSDAWKAGDGVLADGAFTCIGLRTLGGGTVSSIGNVAGSVKLGWSQDHVYAIGSKPALVDSWIYRTYEFYRNYLEQHGETGDYPIAENLPKMRVGDFLKNMMWMTGKFATLDERNGGVMCQSYGELYRKIGNGDVYDVSDWLVMNHGWIPKQMQFYVGDEAMENRVMFKNSEGGSDSSWKVKNWTLKRSRDAIVSDFEWMDERGGLVYIPLYSYEYEEAETEEGETYVRVKKTNFKNVDKPYIARRRKVNGKYRLVRLYWEDLLYNFYGWDAHTESVSADGYVSLMTDARVLDETFVVPSVMFAYFDMTMPLYVRQYGGYFVAEEIKTKQNDVCEVRMVRLR